MAVKLWLCRCLGGIFAEIYNRGTRGILKQSVYLLNRRVGLSSFQMINAANLLYEFGTAIQKKVTQEMNF